MIIQHNMNSANANRQLGVTTGQLSKSTEKLSSGYRINRAGDDAAGLAISEKMRGQIRGLNQASTNSEDGISMIQTAEGALQESQNIIQRMRELAVQSANDTNTDEDREQIQGEIDQLTQEVDRIANTTEFNTKKLINGDQTGSISYKAGSVKVDSTIKNGVASVEATDTTISMAKYAFTETAVIRITIQQAMSNTVDGLSAGAFTVEGLNATVDTGGTFGIAISGTKIIISANGSVYTETAMLSKGDFTYGFTLTNGGKLQAGDVITITIGGSYKEQAAQTGKESLRLQAGANAGQEVELAINSMKAKDLGIVQTALDSVADEGKALDVTSQSKASMAVSMYDQALNKVSTERSKLGAVQNRLEHTISNLDTSSENLQSAESRIRDVDMAQEMTQYSKSNILMQAGQSMLAQANQSTQGVLSLLQ